MEYLTGFLEAKAVKYDTAKEASNFIFERIICRYGFPKILLSDRGAHFVNSLIENLCIEAGIKKVMNSSCHPSEIANKPSMLICCERTNISAKKIKKNKIVPKCYHCGTFRNKKLKEPGVLRSHPIATSQPRLGCISTSTLPLEMQPIPCVN